jgi:putative membrane protein
LGLWNRPSGHFSKKIWVVYLEINGDSMKQVWSAPSGTMFPSRRASLAGLLLVIGASWIAPLHPAEQALHNSLTVIALLLMWRFTARLQISERDFFFIALFLAVHSVAARWLYSYIPYNAWIESLCGFSINAKMGWTRNHFDRLVHFMFGVCFTPGIASYALRRYQITPRRAFYISISAIMILSLWYEWFELAIALTLSGEDAEAYNGQQGDVWDAHKDMLLATLGSLCWILAYPVKTRHAISV